MSQLISKNSKNKALELLRAGRLIRLSELVLITISHTRLRPLFVYDRFYVLSGDDGPSKIKSRLRTITIREATIADVPKMNELDDQRDLYEKQLKGGDIGFIAESDNRIVGMKWIRLSSEDVIKQDEYLIKFPPASAISMGAYIDPRFRYSGLWINLAEEITKYARERSIKRIFCYIDGVNDRSVQTQLKYGSRIVEQIVYVRLLTLRIYLKWVYNRGGRRAFFGARFRVSPICLSQDRFQRVVLTSGEE
jgi:GNAT superfamily N-acetyltransferase